MGHRRFANLASALLLATLAMAGSYLASAEPMYKYLGEDGEWIYTDRKPDDDKGVEVFELEDSYDEPGFSVTHQFAGRDIQFVAHNNFYLPVEVKLDFVEITGVSFPDPDMELRWVVAPRGEEVLMQLQVLEEAAAPQLQYRFAFVPGDPMATHNAPEGYRAPFPLGLDFPVSQAFPDVLTHQTLDSQFAVDIAMPVGTDVLAARGGVVFAVEANNYRGGLDRDRDGPMANVVHIVHDDGTFSLYAHLNWNSIRVQPGDRVNAGQYIADSGNTGYSSGPHLHFAVQQNTGFSVESLPFVFRGSNASQVVPATGKALTAYP